MHCIGAVVTIEFQPLAERATITQHVTDLCSGSKSTTTLTVTWGGEKKPDTQSRHCLSASCEHRSHSRDVALADDQTEAELPSLSKFQVEEATLVPRSKFKAEDPLDDRYRNAHDGNEMVESQPWRQLSGKDDRPIRVHSRGDNGSQTDPKSQVLIYDMRN